MLDYPQTTTILGCTLRLTCEACPEQYDVFYMGKQIGYLRLRHGNFSADYPDVMGKLVYSAHPRGDGTFEADERLSYLTGAVRALLNKHSGKDFNVQIVPGVRMDLSFSEATALYEQLGGLLYPSYPS